MTSPTESSPAQPSHSNGSGNQMMVFQLREQQIRMCDQEIRMRDQEIRAKEVDQRGEQSALIQDMARTIMQLANRNAPTHSTEGFRGFATQIQVIPHDKE